MALRRYSSNAVATTLSAGIDDVVTSLVVADASNYPAAPFIIAVDAGAASEELILVGAKAGTTFSSLTRGFDSTTASSHSAGAVIKHVISGQDLAEIWEHDHDTANGYTAVDHGDLAGVGSDDHHAESHTVASHSDTTATGAELETLTDGSDAADIHIHDARYYTEAEADAAIDADVATHEADGDAHHSEAHTIASHSDTTGTGAELEELTDGSETTLHKHAILGALDYCELIRASSTQAIAASTEEAIEWNSEVYDGPGWHDTGTNPERITFDFNGIIIVTAVSIETGGGSMPIAIRKNGTTFMNQEGGVDPDTQPTTLIMSVSNGDYIEAIVYGGAGGQVIAVNSITKPNRILVARLM